MFQVVFFGFLRFPSLFNGQIKRTVGAVHFNRTVTSKSFVVMNWATLVVSGLCCDIKCSSVTISLAGVLSSFGCPNKSFVTRLIILLKTNFPPFELSAFVTSTETKVERQHQATVCRQIRRAKQQIFFSFSKLYGGLRTISFCLVLYQLLLFGV